MTFHPRIGGRAGPPAVIAHRGASRLERENTVAAFETARAVGASMVELDVRRLADGALAVHHDAELPDGRPLASLVRSDLPPHVPLLARALAACEGMEVNVEIKNDPGEAGFAEDLADAVVAEVRALGWADRVLVSSFHLATAMRARNLGLASAWLVVAVATDTVAIVADAHLDALHPWDRSVTAPLVEACHGAGIRINVWTVDDPQRMGELASWGVDGICTNVPDIAVAVLEAPPTG